MIRMQKRPKVSILIVGRNARGEVEKLFDSMKKLTYPKRLYEVVFVDDGSTDGTGGIAKKYGAKVFRFPTRQGRAKVRNKALSLAKNSIIAWIDTDCEIEDPRWIENMLKQLKGKVIGVAGDQLKPRGGLPRVMWYLPGTAFTATKVEPASFAPTTSSMFLKKPLLEIGGFDANLITAEDLEICWRLGRKGYKFVKTPEAAIVHNFRSTFRRFIDQQYERGIFGGYLFRMYPLGALGKFLDKLIYVIPFVGIALLLWPKLAYLFLLFPIFFHFGLGYLNFFPGVLWNYLKNERNIFGALQLVLAEYIKTYALLAGLLAYQLRELRGSR